MHIFNLMSKHTIILYIKWLKLAAMLKQCALCVEIARYFSTEQMILILLSFIGATVVVLLGILWYSQEC